MAKRHKLSKSSLHWFIKSRPYVLVPDIRRRFELETVDEAVPIVAPKGRAFVALPSRAARLLEDLVKEQRVGLEMAADLNAPMVVGVYAFDLLRQPVGQVQMRPAGAPEPEPAEGEVDDEAGAARPVSGPPAAPRPPHGSRDSFRPGPAARGPGGRPQRQAGGRRFDRRPPPPRREA